MSEAASDPQPKPIHVLLANVVGVQAELLADLIACQPDMRLVGQVEDNLDLLLASQGVDVLVFGAPSLIPLPGICGNLLVESPDMRIVVLTATGETAMVYWLGLRRRRLGLSSEKGLATSIRNIYLLNQLE